MIVHVRQNLLQNVHLAIQIKIDEIIITQHHDRDLPQSFVVDLFRHYRQQMQYRAVLDIQSYTRFHLHLQYVDDVIAIHQLELDFSFDNRTVYSLTAWV